MVVVVVVVVESERINNTYLYFTFNDEYGFNWCL
jgi:hypothetical protein